MGLSTRDVKKVSKNIYGKTYSQGFVSRFNKELGELLHFGKKGPLRRR